MLDWNETKEIPELPVDEFLVGGRLSVLDVSETDDRSRNLAIAYVLQALFNLVIETPRDEIMPTGQPRPPVLVVIEEVHTFVSRAAASKMRALIDNLQVISRRGRKRWMALALVSQQPNHVPDEMFELANTRFIHQIKSKTNLDPVKETTGGVDEKLWTAIPAMEPGKCLFAGSVFRNPLFVDVRPARSRRMLVS
jgi:DNA helicase HerA-like ATPase